MGLDWVAGGGGCDAMNGRMTGAAGAVVFVVGGAIVGAAIAAVLA